MKTFAKQLARNLAIAVATMAIINGAIHVFGRLSVKYSD